MLFLEGITSSLPEASACSLKKEMIWWFPRGGPPTKAKGAGGASRPELRAQECKEGRFLPRLATRRQEVRFQDRGGRRLTSSTEQGCAR
jgi:hypothetical protein